MVRNCNNTPSEVIMERIRGVAARTRVANSQKSAPERWCTPARGLTLWGLGQWAPLCTWGERAEGRKGGRGGVFWLAVVLRPYCTQCFVVYFVRARWCSAHRRRRRPPPALAPRLCHFAGASARIRPLPSRVSSAIGQCSYVKPLADGNGARCAEKRRRRYAIS